MVIRSDSVGRDTRVFARVRRRYGPDGEHGRARAEFGGGHAKFRGQFVVVEQPTELYGLVALRNVTVQLYAIAGPHFLVDGKRHDVRQNYNACTYVRTMYDARPSKITIV